MAGGEIVDELSQDEIDRLDPEEREKYFASRERMQAERSEQAAGQIDTEDEERRNLDDKDAVEQAEADLANFISIEEERENEKEAKKKSIEDLDDDIDEIEDSELVRYLSSIDGDDLQDTAVWLNELKDELKSFLKYKSMDLTSGAFTKELREFGNLLEEDVESFINTLQGTKNEKGEWVIKPLDETREEVESVGTHNKKTKDAEGNVVITPTEVKRKRNVLTEGATKSVEDIESLRTQLESLWDKKKDTFKAPEKEDYIRIVDAIDFDSVIAKAIEESGLNDARHALVSLSTRKLEVVIDTSGKKIKLRGTLTWKSMGIATMGYKVRGDMPPKHYANTATGETRTALQGKKVGYEGYEKVKPAKPVDTDRLEFFKAIRTRAVLLVGAIR